MISTLFAFIPLAFALQKKPSCFIPGLNSCKPIVVPLVDIFNINQKYGNVSYHWDLNKNLYATFQLDNKKYSMKSSSLYVWSDSNMQGYPNYLIPPTYDYTCATFSVPMSNVCNPSNCRVSDVVSTMTCKSYKDSKICKNADLRFYMVVYTQPSATVVVSPGKKVTVGTYGIGNPNGIVALNNAVSCSI